jgi:1-deoxy-D-xylulose-5-phosphate synthase
MRFVKPLDAQLVEQLAGSHQLLVTLEENTIAGGAGSAVTEHLNHIGLICPTLQLGFGDEFVEHASQKQQLASQGLDAKSIAERISLRLKATTSDARSIAH